MLDEIYSAIRAYEMQTGQSPAAITMHPSTFIDFRHEIEQRAQTELGDRMLFAAKFPEPLAADASLLLFGLPIKVDRQVALGTFKAISQQELDETQARETAAFTHWFDYLKVAAPIAARVWGK